MKLLIRRRSRTLRGSRIAWLPFFVFVSNVLLMNQWDWMAGCACTGPLQRQDGAIGTQFAWDMEQSAHHVCMQFILVAKHRHVCVSSRIIQSGREGFFPFFSFFCVNRCDVICILVAGSYKKGFFSLFSPFLVGMI